jgi:SPX domain protein involved in polyphosphate accumulation
VSQPGQELRHERKLVAEDYSAAELAAVVRMHPAHFSEAHPPRRINSVYFDTAGLRAYRETVSGLSGRTKVRLRWYGAMLGEVPSPRGEVKVKRAAVGGKRRFDAAPFVMRDGIDGVEIEESLRSGAASPEDARLVAGLCPVIVVTYLRSYWLSRDGRCRLTIDSEIAYLRVRRYGNRFGQPFADAGRVVIELKYALEEDAGAPLVAGRFPVRVSRSSKYARGIELLYAVSK